MWMIACNEVCNIKVPYQVYSGILFMSDHSAPTLSTVLLIAPPCLARTSLQVYVNSVKGVHAVVPEDTDPFGLMALSATSAPFVIFDMVLVKDLSEEAALQVLSTLEQFIWVALIDTFSHRNLAISHGAQGLFFKGMIGENLKQVILSSIAVTQNYSEGCTPDVEESF